ncbi:hypothetical protein V498_09561, partial [Pseudogymnoascus sp. VKM F-4517 (FW-2822)]
RRRGRNPLVSPRRLCRRNLREPHVSPPARGAPLPHHLPHQQHREQEHHEPRLGQPGAELEAREQAGRGAQGVRAQERGWGGEGEDGTGDSRAEGLGDEE